MDLDVQFDEYSIERAIEYGRQQVGDRWNIAVETVLKVALSDKRNLPKLGFRQQPIIFSDYIRKWLDSYFKGYDSRPSVKTGNPSGTAPDLVVGVILQAKLPHLTDETVSQVVEGHSLLMSIENFVGQLLEEYLSVKLEKDGWYCCWGNTLDAIDFCKDDGSLLQVKTSDNSENSSSSRVRNGTTIEKWARRNSKKANSYYWDDLNQELGRSDLSEQDFRAFAVDLVKNNPSCINVPDNHILRRSK